MKKVFMMLAAVAALTITSCGKGGDKNAADSDSVKAETEVTEPAAEEATEEAPAEEAEAEEAPAEEAAAEEAPAEEAAPEA